MAATTTMVMHPVTMRVLIQKGIARVGMIIHYTPSGIITTRDIGQTSMEDTIIALIIGVHTIVPIFILMVTWDLVIPGIHISPLISDITTTAIHPMDMATIPMDITVVIITTTTAIIITKSRTPVTTFTGTTIRDQWGFNLQTEIQDHTDTTGLKEAAPIHRDLLVILVTRLRGPTIADQGDNLVVRAT